MVKIKSMLYSDIKWVKSMIIIIYHYCVCFPSQRTKIFRDSRITRLEGDLLPNKKKTECNNFILSFCLNCYWILDKYHHKKIECTIEKRQPWGKPLLIIQFIENLFSQQGNGQMWLATITTLVILSLDCFLGGLYHWYVRAYVLSIIVRSLIYLFRNFERRWEHLLI